MSEIGMVDRDSIDVDSFEHLIDYYSLSNLSNIFLPVYLILLLDILNYHHLLSSNWQ